MAWPWPTDRVWFTYGKDGTVEIWGQYTRRSGESMNYFVESFEDSTQASHIGRALLSVVAEDEPGWPIFALAWGEHERTPAFLAAI
jgi:hypothetical protein